MKYLASIASLSLCLFFGVSCSKEPGPKIEGLQFPVVILFGNAATLICKESAEMTNMHTNYIVLGEGTPVLIDSEFKIYSLEHFRSVHGGLWLMANPSGATDVTFDLKAQKSGRENARELFARHLEKQTWLSDLESRRKSLAAKQTLLEMAALVQNTGD